MTAVALHATRGRSIAAVAGGFLVTAVLSTAMDAVMHGTSVFPPMGQAMSDGLYLWAAAYRAAFTVLGGYVTARLAPRAALRHAVILAFIGVLAATAGTVATWNLGPEFGPKWYPISLIVTALPCVLAGAWIVTRSDAPTLVAQVKP